MTRVQELHLGPAVPRQRSGFQARGGLSEDFHNPFGVLDVVAVIVESAQVQLLLEPGQPPLVKAAEGDDLEVRIGRHVWDVRPAVERAASDETSMMMGLTRSVDLGTLPKSRRPSRGFVDFLSNLSFLWMGWWGRHSASCPDNANPGPTAWNQGASRPARVGHAYWPRPRYHNYGSIRRIAPLS